MTSIAHSIRRAVSDGRVNEGYQIFTQYQFQSLNNPKPWNKNSKNGRFLAHVLVHALLRSKKPALAASFVKMCTQRGIKLRDVTFEKIFQSLCKPFDKPGLKVSPFVPMSTATPSAPSSLKAAVTLLDAAKESGNKRSSWMYDRLINLLLLQGEVLTAAFLFAALVREWNYRRNNRRFTSGISGSKEASGDLHKRSMPPPPSPRPSPKTMHKIVKSVLATRSVPSADREREGSIVQALTILVDLVHEDPRSVPARAAVLHAMPLVPRYMFADRTIYDRWHSILLNLSTVTADSPPLDIASYHVLLQYTLRHRRSVRLATGVIKAMCTHHSPTIITYNILLRELTLLRYNRLAEAIRARLTNDHALPIPTLTATKDDAGQEHEIIRELRRHPSPAPDEATLSAIMSMFIARGEPKAACEVVTQIFPKLRRSKGIVQTEKGGLVARIRSQRPSPHFWATALNAALKCSSLTFAARVWSLVARTELSHGNHRRRAYSVEAYTSHLQLFVKELQKIYDQTRVPADRTSPAILLARYSFVLRLAQRVLTGLRRRTQSADAADFRADALLFDTLLNLAEVIERLEQFSKLEAGPASGKFKQSRLRHQNSRNSRFNRSQDSIRAILARYRVHIPAHIRQLGFHKDPIIEAPSGRDRTPLRRQPAIRFSARPSFYVRKTKHGYRIAYARGSPKDKSARDNGEETMRMVVGK